MRPVALALLLVVGCGRDHGSTRAPDLDAFVPDTNFEFCTAAAGTANITATTAAPTTASFSRLHAGGVQNLSEFSLKLQLSNVDPLPALTGWCCNNADPSCCMMEGLLVLSPAFAPGAELGTHPAHIRGFQDPTFMLEGSLTITSFVQPFDHAPGRVAGSISASAGGRTVSGTFDNTFCAALLGVTAFR